MTDTTYVYWLSYDPDTPADRYAYWDRAFLNDLLDGRVWRPPGTPNYVHRVNEEPTGGDVVIVVPGRGFPTDDSYARLNAAIARCASVRLFVTSDEERRFDLTRLADHPNVTVWMSYWRPGDAAQRLPIGYRPGTREHYAARPAPPPWDRPLRWYFAGQVTHSRRQDLAEALNSRPDGEGDAVFTDGFARGIDQAAYLDGLARAVHAPAPSGPVHVDSFRFGEALEAGCVAIVDTHTPTDDMTSVWAWYPGVRWVRSWRDDLAPVMDATTGALRVRAQDQWLNARRDLAYAVHRPTVPAAAVTAVITASPIGSHPDTSILDETIASIRDRLPDSEIVVAFDGVRVEDEHLTDRYHEHIDRVCWAARHRWHNVLPVVMSTHCHQAVATRFAFDHVVRTPNVLFLEHDTPLHGDIPFADLVPLVADGDLDVVRLYHEGRVPREHRHLMLDTTPRKFRGVPIIRTAQWSQRPHLARTDWYADILDRYFDDESRTFIEDVMHGVVDYHYRTDGDAGWEQFRLGIYAPRGDMRRSGHTDGRAGAAKWDDRLIFKYPGGGTPPGAPRATEDRVD